MILKHLLNKEDHQDSLDGLILKIYNAEIKELSKEISKSLRYLVSTGLVGEVVDASGKKQYRLIKDKEEVSRFVDYLI
jgi:hypothetical protein